jgi:hypothetical protein
MLVRKAYRARANGIREEVLGGGCPLLLALGTSVASKINNASVG